MILITLSGMRLESMMKIKVYSIFEMVSTNIFKTILRFLDSTGSTKENHTRQVAMLTREYLKNPNTSLTFQQ